MRVTQGIEGAYIYILFLCLHTGCCVDLPVNRLGRIVGFSIQFIGPRFMPRVLQEQRALFW